MNIQEPIILKQRLNISKEKLWNALTNLEELQMWFFDVIEDYNPELGFTTQFLITNEGRKFTHIWEIIEVIPFKKIATKWTFEEYQGEGLVIFTIEDFGNYCELTVLDKVIKSFPKDVPEFKRESGVEGWNYFINKRLTNYLKI